MWSMLEGGINLVLSPWWCLSLEGYSFVAVLLQKSRRWVVKVLNFVQVAGSLAMTYEVFKH